MKATSNHWSVLEYETSSSLQFGTALWGTVSQPTAMPCPASWQVSV